MIIINILGGLGNQMFQYAFGYALAKKNEKVLKLDINSFETYSLRVYELDLFNIDTPLASKDEVESLKFMHENVFEKLLRRIRKKPKKTSIYREAHFHFDNEAYSIKGNKYMDGYWQSEKYFKKHRKGLLKLFSLKKELSSQSQRYNHNILVEESVSLHIRRGDYVLNEHINTVHGTCDLEYYQRAVDLIQGRINDTHFYIFSDDLEWAKNNLDFIDNMTFVELADNIPDHEEMYLMSQCKHNIIANSSFSWWGAWLNQNSNKMVITPKQWFNDASIDTSDLIPKDWIRL